MTHLLTQTLELLAYGLGALAGSFVAASAATLLALQPKRRQRPVHWTEVARLSFPARQLSVSLLILVPVLIGAPAALDAPAQPPVPAFILVAVAAVTAIAGAAGAAFWLQRSLYGKVVPLGYWLQGGVTWILLLMPHLFIIVLAIGLTTDDFDARTVIVLALAAGGFVACLVLLVGMMPLRRLARRMEVTADQAGRDHETEAGQYARVLERLYEVNLTPVVMHDRRQAHPHLYDRLLSAGVQPAYPRPRPPSRAWVALPLVVGLALAFASGVGLQMLIGGQWQVPWLFPSERPPLPMNASGPAARAAASVEPAT